MRESFKTSVRVGSQEEVGGRKEEYAKNLPILL